MSGTTFLHALAVAALLALPACTPASPPTKDDPMSRAPAPADKFNLQPVKEWPLKFDSHSFSAFTYDTYGARVVYAGLQQRNDEPDVLQKSSASYGPNYRKNWAGTHAQIRNFPAPAKVSWRSKDGTPHETEIDIAALFADEVIRHNVAREDVSDLPDGEHRSEPSILMEINDRTIRIYMRAMIYTRELQEPGNRYSGFRHDLVLVDSRTY
ncbi:MAG: hypothetical protein NDI84_17130 [Steroidobacteraceae bacterium]|nr:hypothetical protein [Steroidobacteraceae bacterium]